MNPHNITKIIRKNSFDYYCKDCNASYPTKKSLIEDHPNLDDTLIIIYDKRELEEALEIKLKQAFRNAKSHTQILAENNS